MTNAINLSSSGPVQPVIRMTRHLLKPSFPHFFGGNPVGLRCEDAGYPTKTLGDDERVAIVEIIGNATISYGC